MTADTGFRARDATSFDRVAVVSDDDSLRGDRMVAPPVDQEI